MDLVQWTSTIKLFEGMIAWLRIDGWCGRLGWWSRGRGCGQDSWWVAWWVCLDEWGRRETADALSCGCFDRRGAPTALAVDPRRGEKQEWRG